MEIRGAEIFSKINNRLTATKLKNLLRSQHATKQSATTLIHPSPSSLYSFDIVFNPTRWSVGATSFTKKLDELQHSCSQYLIILITISWWMNTPNGRKTREELSRCVDREVIENRKREIVQKLAKDLYETDTMKRCGDIASVFIHMIKLYLSLGCVPCYPKIIASKSSRSSSYVDQFITIIEIGCRKVNPLSVDEIISDVIITESEGVRRASRVKEETRNLQLFSFEPDSVLLPHLLKAPPFRIGSLVCKEIQYAYACEESNKLLLTHLNQTYLVVSSELTDEAQKMLLSSKRMTDVLESNSLDEKIRQTSKIIARAEQSNKEMKLLDETRRNIEKEYEEITKQDGSDLEKVKLSDWSKVLGKLMNEIHLGASIRKQLVENSIMHNIPEVRDIVMADTVDLDAGLPNNVNPIDLVMNGTAGTKPDRSYQSKMLKNSLINLEKILKKQNSTINQLKHTIQQVNEAYEKQLEINKAQKVALEGAEMNDKLLKRVSREKDEKNKALKKLLKNCQERFSEVANALQLSEEEREKLIEIGSGRLLSAGKKSLEESFYESSCDGEVSLELMEKQNIISLMLGLLSTCMTTTKDGILKNASDRTRFAFDKVLSEECVRPTPLFFSILDPSDLYIVNTWMPIHHFRDQIARDASTSNPRETIANDECKKAITSNRDLFIFDINPISNEKMAASVNKTFDEIGHHPTSIFNYRYLFSQMKSKSDVRKFISEDLQTSWQQSIQNFFHLTDPLYTLSGQKTTPQLTAKTFNLLMGSFLKLCAGSNIKGIEMASGKLSAILHAFAGLGEPMLEDLIHRTLFTS